MVEKRTMLKNSFDSDSTEWEKLFTSIYLHVSNVYCIVLGMGQTKLFVATVLNVPQVKGEKSR